MSMLFASMAGGEEGGLEALKCFVRGRQNFFYLLCVCVWGGGGGGSGSVPLLPITKRPKGHYVAYLFLRYFLLLDVVVLFHLLAIADKIYGNHCAPWSVEILIKYAFP